MPMTTVTLDVKSGNGEDVQKHLEHDSKINHSNKDIDFDSTKYNMKADFCNKRELLEKQYGQFVKEHDNKQTRKSRKYGSVAKYLSRSKGDGSELLVATLGSYESTHDEQTGYIRQLENAGLKPEDVHELMSEAMMNYAKGFNKRNEAMQMVSATSHVDERGAFHLHAEIVPLGHTNTGKPSKNFDVAVAQTYGVPYEKGKSNVRMSQWRRDEDPQFLKAINEIIAQKYPTLGSEFFTLDRKVEHNGLSHDEYKAKAKVQDAFNEQEKSAEELFVKRAQAIHGEHALELQTTVNNLRKVEIANPEYKKIEDRQWLIPSQAERIEDNKKRKLTTKPAMSDETILDNQREDISTPTGLQQFAQMSLGWLREKKEAVQEELTGYYDRLVNWANDISKQQMDLTRREAKLESDRQESFNLINYEIGKYIKLSPQDKQEVQKRETGSKPNYVGIIREVNSDRAVINKVRNQGQVQNQATVKNQEQQMSGPDA